VEISAVPGGDPSFTVTRGGRQGVVSFTVDDIGLAGQRVFGRRGFFRNGPPDADAAGGKGSGQQDQGQKKAYGSEHLQVPVIHPVLLAPALDGNNPVPFCPATKALMESPSEPLVIISKIIL
jgi:hypothetical protein